MCVCGSDRNPGFRQCCGSLSLQRKEEAVKELQKTYMDDTIVNHPKYEEIMLMSHHGLNILTGRIDLLKRMKGASK